MDIRTGKVVDGPMAGMTLTHRGEIYTLPVMSDDGNIVSTLMYKFTDDGEWKLVP